MTPLAQRERAVLDAARAWRASLPNDRAGALLGGQSLRLMDAVDALATPAPSLEPSALLAATLRAEHPAAAVRTLNVLCWPSKTAALLSADATLADLAALSCRDMRQRRGFGDVCLAAVLDVVSRAGLALACGCRSGEPCAQRPQAHRKTGGP